MEDYEKRVRMLEKEKGTLSALMSGWKQSSLDADTMFQKEVAGFKANKIMQLKKRRLIRSANNVFVSLGMFPLDSSIPCPCRFGQRCLT